MIPHDRDSGTRKRTLVTSSYRIVPRFIVGMQVQLVVGYVVLKPFADTRMALGIEVHKILRIVRAIVAADHIKIEITLNLADIFVAVHKITRAK